MNANKHKQADMLDILHLDHFKQYHYNSCSSLFVFNEKKVEENYTCIAKFGWLTYDFNVIISTMRKQISSEVKFLDLRSIVQYFMIHVMILTTEPYISVGFVFSVHVFKRDILLLK